MVTISGFGDDMDRTTAQVLTEIEELLKEQKRIGNRLAALIKEKENKQNEHFKFEQAA